MRRSSFLKILVTALAVVSCGFSYGQSDLEILSVTEKSNVVLVGKHVYVLEDATNLLKISDLLKNEYQQLFKRSTRDVYSRPASSAGVWFKITLENLTGEDLWLETGTPFANWYIEFYRPQDNYEKPTLSGSQRPVSQKEYPVNNYWFKLMSPHEKGPQTFYVKFRSNFPHQYPLKVGTLQALNTSQKFYDFLFAGFVGMMVIMGFYNLFLAWATADRIYLTYVAYLITGTIVVLFDTGRPFSFDPWWWQNFLIWHNIGPLFAGFFTLQYLNVQRRAPRLNVMIWLLMLTLSILFPVLNILGVSKVALIDFYQGMIVLFYVTLLLSGIYLWTKGYKSAIFFVAGWSFLIISIIIFMLTVNGFLPLNIFSGNALYFGVSLEVLMFSSALADRLNTMKNKKERAQQRNIKLVQEQNEILELSINERTLQINLQKKEIEEQADQLKKMNEQLVEFNSNLADLVAERANTIVTQEQKLADYAFINSHKLRAPVATLRGLIHLMEGGHIQEGELKEVIHRIGESAATIDEIISEINRAIEQVQSN
jgi:hypothetical protein